MSMLTVRYRVGGNLQDLVTRASMAAFGAVWAGVAYSAGHGNPYVLGAFAVAYMTPMLYRFTQSSHPVGGTSRVKPVPV